MFKTGWDLIGCILASFYALGFVYVLIGIIIDKFRK